MLLVTINVNYGLLNGYKLIKKLKRLVIENVPYFIGLVLVTRAVVRGVGREQKSKKNEFDGMLTLTFCQTKDDKPNI